MSERKSKHVAPQMSDRTSEGPWSVPVALSEVPETGRHVDLVADERRREAIAKLAGLVPLHSDYDSLALGLRVEAGSG
jgi:hypothetical protein